MTTSDPVKARTPACFDSDPEAHDELVTLFASTSKHDHTIARMICDDCPVRAACLTIAQDIAKTTRWAGGPEGTWGGVLWIAGKPTRRALSDQVPA